MTDIQSELVGDRAIVIQGDCRDVAAHVGPVDAVVCDPPYGLSFMGRGWDRGVPGVEFWQAVGGP